MSAFQTKLTDAEIKLSEMAASKMAELISDADEGIEAVRVFVTGGGCSGMTYGMTFTDTCTEYDGTLECNGVKVYVDSVALAFLKGVEIDYVERDTGASFVFNNVFSATGGSGSCGGCGSAGGGCG